jgi:hypothetical protein
MAHEACQGPLRRYGGPESQEIAMPKSPYEGGKQRKHFTLSETAYTHLSNIAASAVLSRSEALERLIRSIPAWEGAASLSDAAWPSCIDHSQNSTESIEFLS